MVDEVVLQPLSAAFLDVGVYVALFAAAAAWLRWRHGQRLQDALHRYRRRGPVVGALLGVSPGCGGAVLVVPLYVSGNVSFGTVVAALTATMGDSSWVLLAGSPGTAVAVHVVLLVTGLVTGFAVDALGIDPRRGRSGDRSAATPPVPGQVRPPTSPLPTPRSGLDRTRTRVLHGVGPVALAFWLVAGAGAGVGVPVSFRLLDPALLGAGGSVDVPLVVGALGTCLCVAIFVRGRGRFADDAGEDAGCWTADLPTGLRHAASETAFVVVWVAVAYVALSLLDNTVGLPLEALPLAGAAGVLVGALVGLVPGCGMQIAFTSAYLAGAAGAPALLANAVAQDGDALLPLLALDRRTAATASVITTVPALAVGSLALLVL
ncbi:putative manganese transporter [Thalassiella azotivora]